MSPLIRIRSTQLVVPVNTKWCHSRLRSMLEFLELKDWGVSLWLTDNETMRNINEEHRGIPRATDILSFPRHSYLRTPGRLPPLNTLRESDRGLGDLIISIPYAETYCKEQSTYLELEDHMPVLFAHGICHLLGFDHETKSDHIKMQNQEDLILGAKGYIRNLTKKEKGIPFLESISIDTI